MRIVIAFMLGALWIFSAGLHATSARTWYIKPDGTGDAVTIQAGITSAMNGDTVLLAPGTFTGTGNRDISLQGKAITVTSEAGPNETVIDCQGFTHAFDLERGGGPSTVISQLTIQNGYSSHGGAIQCNAASPRIEFNVIRNCRATLYGGGICCTSSYPTVRYNLVTGCAAPAGGGISLYNCFSATSIANNTITDNTASQKGGGVHCWDSSPNIANNTIVGNGAPLGGGIFFSGPDAPVVSSTIIAFGTQGEGMACSLGASPWISYCDVFGNAGGDAICGQDGGLNFSADPEFCGPAGVGEYWLWDTSPCAPANNPLHWVIGAWPVGCWATGIDIEESAQPQLKLMPSYPNPFTPSTHVAFSLDRESHVELVIFDVAGRRVRTLIDHRLSPGPHVEGWDGRDDRGTEVPDGVYFLRLGVGHRTLTGKVVRIR